jgi:hypothetical protein
MDALVLRRWGLIPAAVVLGALIGLLVSLAQSTDRRAEASVLISSPRGPSAVTPHLPNLRELATSGVLAGNVRSTLRLDESIADVRDRLDAEVRPASQVIVLAATDEQGEIARQIAQEAAAVFTRLVDARFGTRTPPLQAAVLDSAHALSAEDRHFVRNALIGAAAGLLIGAVAAVLLGGAALPVRAEAVPADLRERERALERRIKEVTKREREIARQAGRLAAREKQLETRPARPPAPEPTPAPPPAEAPTAVAVSGAGGWNVNELERAVDARTDVSAETLEQWRTYLFFLRDHAEIDGRLPPRFDSLVEDVFDQLLR